jgi:preprotein translocase subunit YajC
VDVDGDDVILEVAPGVEVRYMRRAVMDVVSPGEAVDEDEASADEADEADTDYAEESEETEAHDAEETDDAPAPVAHDAEETAYEQATGRKKD